MTRRQDGAGRRASRTRMLLVIAALLAAVLAALIGYWVSDDGKANTPPPGEGQAAEQNNGGNEAADDTGGEAGGNAGQSDGGGEDAAGDDEGQAEDAADEPADPDADVTQADLDRTYDIVIANGRVINPETKLDREGMNVGIIGKTIEVVTSKPLKGERVIDAAGQVVAPGFIDNLSYDPNPVGVWTKIADGVTTNIAMHGGTTNPKVWYAHYERDEPPVHFGASFFVMQARNQFKLSRYEAATSEQIAKMKQQAEKALNEGALGISFSLEYAPGTSSEEVLELMEVAREYNVPVYFHGRYSDVQEPGTETDTMNEIIEYARKSGAAVHIDHINSTGGTFDMKKALAMIDAARAEGLDITACTYAYDYWGTYLNSARFDAGWQERFRIGYEDLQIAGTDERLDAESFARYRKEGKLAVAYAIPSESVLEAFKAPYVMIGSDAILEPGYNNHPRASGNFARAVGLYVREHNVVPLIDMIDKLSTMPAKRLEKQAPALRKKGRIARGMDADIVVFDFETIADEATVARPELPSKGISYVLVEGELAMDDGVINKKVRPGHGIYSEFQRVTESAGTLRWDGADYPLVGFNEARYVDLAAVTKHGFGLTWDVTTKTYTIASGGSSGMAGQADPAAAPASGTLMLERGYRVQLAGGAAAELLSIGERAYMPLSYLSALGVTVSDEGDIVVAG